MSRRMGRICRRLSVVMSRPSKTILPAVGSSSLMIVRPSVVLPQPDSPTMPSVSPGCTVRSTPSTALTCPTVCLNSPALIGKCLTRPSTAEQLAAVRRRRLGGDGSLRLAHGRSPTPDPTPARSRAELLGEVAGGAMRLAPPPALLSAGTSVRQIARPCDTRAAGVESASRREADEARRLSRDRLEPLLVGIEPRQAAS